MRKVFYFCLALAAIAIAGQTYFKPHPNKSRIPADGKIVCFGDSLTSGVGATPGQAYPDQLAVLLSRPVINAGRSGDTTQSASLRLQTDVLSHAPHTVILALGANDLLRGISHEKAFKNLKAMIQEIQTSGALVVVGGVDVPFWGRGYGEMYLELCRETGSICIPNILEGILGNQALMSDPIHPNNAGYRRMADLVYQTLKPHL
jgi:lysophospholipase L1-like esterase